MTRVIIIEDEGVAARRLTKMLEMEGLQVNAHLKSNEAFKQYLDHHPEPDLYFLDIHLSDGIVFETLVEKSLQSPIIFTTAFDEFAIKAFKQNSIDYLLKPFNQADLQLAIKKYKSLFTNQQMVDLTALSKLFKGDSVTYRSRIRVKIGDRYRIFKMDEVSMIYSHNKYTSIATPEGRSFPIEQTIEQIATELDPHLFFKVNRGQIVHIDYVEDIISYSNSRLKVLVKGQPSVEVIVARDKVKDFKAWLG